MQNIRKRRNDLLDIITREHTTNIHILAKQLNVSEMSIRRDCHVLQNMGKIKISFGKIEYSELNTSEQKGNKIDLINSKIAQIAIDYIHDGQTIFINSSTTAIRVLDYLGDRAVNILTNNLRGIDKKINSESNLILSGGEIRNNSNILTGDIALNSFNNVRASISLIGCGGFDIETGITTTNIHEAQINRVIINNCEKLIVLTNFKKINKTTNFTVGSIKDVDILITDVYADEKYIKQIRNAGVQVVQVQI